jgi:hypothetical protein
MITDKNITEFITSWRDGIILVQKAYIANNDYKERARHFVDNHYLFNEELVLFKPTLTNDVVFRNTTDDALSYFIGGKYPEDKGFALKDFKDIEVDEINTIIEKELIAVMGVFILKLKNTNDPTRIAFTFILKSTINGLKIKIHHSSLIT